MVDEPHPAAGHRLVAGPATCEIEAWGPDRVTCLAEAVAALVEEFADVQDAPATEVLPVAAGPGEAADALESLLQQVIDALVVLSVAPVRMHLAETEDGAVAGDMEVVPIRTVRRGGRVPRAVSCHRLAVEPADGGWRCHAVVAV